MLFCVIIILGSSLSNTKCSQLLGAAGGIWGVQYPLHRVSCSDLIREVFTPGLGGPILVWEAWLRQLFFFQPVS